MSCRPRWSWAVVEGATLLVRCLLLGTLVACEWLLLPSDALAGSRCERAVADLTSRGIEEYKKGAYEQSVALFEQARQRCPDHEILLYYLAKAYDKLGRTAEAIAQYEQYAVRAQSIAGQADFLAQASARIAELRRASKGDIFVTCTPPVLPAARVTIDGRSAGGCPASVSGLQPGTHLVRVEAEGYRLWERTTELQAGAKARVKAELKLASGYLAVSTLPAGAQVLLDGQPAGVAPLTRLPASAGSHRLVLRLDGYRETEQKVEVPPDETMKVEAVLLPTVAPAVLSTDAEAPSEERHSRIVKGSVATGIGLLTAAGALVSYLLYSGFAEDWGSAQTRYDQDAFDEASTKGQVAWGAFYGLGAISAGALGYSAYLWISLPPATVPGAPSDAAGGPRAPGAVAGYTRTW